MTDKETTDLFLELDWATLEAWAGAKTLLRGKEYQRNRRVSSLARSHDGTLVARVAGSELYVTAVTNRNGLVSACTCPVGESCKHAVAVILEYIALREKDVPVPPWHRMTRGSHCRTSGQRHSLHNTGMSHATDCSCPDPRFRIPVLEIPGDLPARCGITFRQ